ncbi:ATP-binding protein [Thermaerobacillus caldiproteolyticus]|uniref:ATP-binding protein n=1 Tax=Thermaerobacillus caldiproteolyticus TaxID=247480 RepID=UPI0018F1BE11|nr:ATP-binding protein [Anoxybacillus caldiproteolyticus]
MNKYTIHSDDHSSVLHDSLILEHYGLNELNFESVKSYREKFAAVKPNHPWNGLETKEFLYKIGAWGKLRNSSKEGVTLAGLLMFSEERIITEVLPQYFLEYRESSSDIVTSVWTKRFTSQDGTWSGNVYDFYFKVMAHFTNVDSTLSPALHEALINALVHADYSGEGGIVIEKEQDVFRFSNPGLFRIPIDHAFSGGMSNLRNPNLFKMFILIGLCKRAGSGLKHIEITWKQHQWKQPEFLQHTNPERTILTLTIQSSKYLFPDEMAASYETVHVDDMQQHENDDMNEPMFEQVANSVNNDLYSVNKNHNSVNNDKNSINKGVDSMNNDVKSVNKDPDFISDMMNSVNKDSNFINNPSNSVNNKNDRSSEMASFVESGQIHEELWNIAELARKKKRLHPSVMEQIILQLCAKKPLMLKELATLLARTPDGLRNNYLAKLLDEGKIQLKYPNQPNHPRQAYITKK